MGSPNSGVSGPAYELIAALVAIAGITIGYGCWSWQVGVPEPGGAVGHTIGVVGFLLMLSTETLYSLRKHLKGFTYGPMRRWMQVHVFTGLVGPYLVLLHSAGKFHGLAGWLTLLTAVVVLSGMVGRYIFTAVPRSLDGVELAAAEIEEKIAALDQKFSTDVRGWMATRPVHNWQFKSFLGVAKPKSRFGGDRFDTERFAETDPLAPVVDLYPDEAEAYALWFGKWSVGGLDLQCAESSLTLERKKMLSPDGLLLWDLSPPSSGWYYAVGFQPDTGELLEEEFCDCDRDSRVGLATYAFLKGSSRVKGWNAG
ncbi:MAG TPA: hypothetical protein VFE62_15960 [Gemmataceae bacterium]|nr:hypothetical protein [Gemmataceae bacterium]